MMVENGGINVNKLTISGENVRHENTEYQLSLKETLKDRQWIYEREREIQMVKEGDRWRE